MQHSILQPSGAHRWVNCTAYVPISRNLAPQDSDAAREGRVAHKIAEDMVEAQRRAMQIPRREELVGTVIDGVLITEEMFDGCKIYGDYCGDLMRKTSVFGGEKMGIETRISIPKVHPECFGTCDFWLFDTSTNTIYVIDFKFGFRPVSPVENWQLICYAAGLMNNVNGIVDQTINVVFNIIQPRAFGENTIRKWGCKLSDLRGNVNILNQAAAEALGDNPTCKTGSWCADCEALLGCEAARRAELNAIDYQSKRTDVIVTDGDELGREIAAAERARNALEFRLEALKAEGLSRLQRGERVTGFEVGRGRGSTSWSKSIGEIVAFGDLMGTDLRKPVSPITPKQALKLGLDEAVIAAFSESKTGAAKLVPTNDKKVKEILQNV